MRKVARARDGSGARWVILHETAEGVYLFPCASDDDGSACGDSWFSTLEEAEQACTESYGIRACDWIAVGDPLPGCQQDWISPARVPGRETGNPRWGTLERLIDGRWTRVSPADPRPGIEAAIRAARADRGTAESG